MPDPTLSPSEYAVLRQPSPEGRAMLSNERFGNTLPYVVYSRESTRARWLLREPGRRQRTFSNVPGDQAFVDEYWRLRGEGRTSEEIEAMKRDPRMGRNWRLSTDLTGQRIGRWLVLRAGQRRGPRNVPTWLCRCECGTEREVTTLSLARNSKSCGCLAAETASTSKKL